MRYRNALVATAMAGLPLGFLALSSGVANAQPLTGPYVSLGAGLHAPENPKATVYGPVGTGTVNLNQGYGFNSELAVGYGIGNGFRFEVEGDFMRARSAHFGGTPFPTAAAGMSGPGA